MKYKYISFGKKILEKSIFTPITNEYGFVKPNGGIWASIYTPDKEFLSSWHEYCIDIGIRLNRMNTATLFNISEFSRVYTIDSMDDLIKLSDSYSYGIEGSRKRFLDFEKIKDKYDAIYLTEEGELRTRNNLFDRSFNIDLFSWDCESLLILNFNIITEQEGIDIL